MHKINFVCIFTDVMEFYNSRITNCSVGHKTHDQIAFVAQYVIHQAIMDISLDLKKGIVGILGFQV